MPNRVIKSKAKPKRPAFLSRTSSSSKARSLSARLPSRQNAARRARSPSSASDSSSDSSSLLSDHGLLSSLAPALLPAPPPRDVLSAIRHHAGPRNAFDDVPAERSGMNSTRTAEVLNFRLRLPPLATGLHVHAVSPENPTGVEREVARLVAEGKVKRAKVPGRGGAGRASISEGLVSVEDWIALVREERVDVGVETKDKYCALLSAKPSSMSYPRSFRDYFAPEEISELVRAGLLTRISSSGLPSSSAYSSSLSGYSAGGGGGGGIMVNYTTANTGSKSTATSLAGIARAASGSVEAVGGTGAVHSAGGGGHSRALLLSTPEGSQQQQQQQQQRRSLPPPGRNQDQPAAVKPRPRDADLDLALSLPNTGALLGLIEDARAHLLSLLRRGGEGGGGSSGGGSNSSKKKKKKHRSGPRHAEAPMYLLRERWDGGVNTKVPYGRSRDPFRMVLPGKTRKWRELYGLRFEWALAECLGAGLVQVFDTGSVGYGVRVAP